MTAGEPLGSAPEGVPVPHGRTPGGGASEGGMPWGVVVAAGAAVLAGLGLARFGYSPLLPVLIGRGWFGPGDAAYLGAANLLGYLLGALAARRAGARLGARAVLRGSMLVAALSLLACCRPLPFAWFLMWRLGSGVAGGLLMILAPSAALVLVPAARRGLAGGLILTGVGLGIAASGTLVPLLLARGLTAAWLGLGGVALVLTVLAWGAWPAPMPGGGTGRVAATPGRAVPAAAVRGGVSWAACLSYGLCAVGLVPHMVFLVDYVARGQGRGLAAGGLAWVLFGVGALGGAVVAGRLADRLGGAAAMRVVIGSELLAVLCLWLVHASVAGGAALVLAGLCVTGVTAAMLGRVGELVGEDPLLRQRGWTHATVAWAAGQAAGAYGLAWLFARTGGYAALFAVAVGALLLAAANEAGMAVRARRTGRRSWKAS